MIPALLAIAAAALYLFARDLIEPMAPLVKAIPAVVLAGFVFRSGPRPARQVSALGLLCSAVADAAIEFSFIWGLGIFLVAHLLYIVAFTRIDSHVRLLRLTPVALWASLALPFLVMNAGSLRVPVLVYGLVIFAMIWRAAAAVSEPGWNPGTIGLTGAVLFGISDTLLGYVRFVTDVPGSRLLIMVTYWAGQTLIATSFIRQRPHRP